MRDACAWFLVLQFLALALFGQPLLAQSQLFFLLLHRRHGVGVIGVSVALHLTCPCSLACARCVAPGSSTRASDNHDEEERKEASADEQRKEASADEHIDASIVIESEEEERPRAARARREAKEQAASASAAAASRRSSRRSGHSNRRRHRSPSSSSSSESERSSSSESDSSSSESDSDDGRSAKEQLQQLRRKLRAQERKKHAEIHARTCTRCIRCGDCQHAICHSGCNCGSDCKKPKTSSKKKKDRLIEKAMASVKHRRH
jgi:hypothetical protein